MASYVIGLFGDMLGAIIGAEIFAPVVVLALLAIGLTAFRSLQK